MKTVKDVMSTLPVSVSKTTSFREIAARLRECRVSAFPVLDADGKVTGVVSEADLLVKEAVPGEPGGVGDCWRARAPRRAGQGGRQSPRPT